MAAVQYNRAVRKDKVKLCGFTNRLNRFVCVFNSRHFNSDAVGTLNGYGSFRNAHLVNTVIQYGSGLLHKLLELVPCFIGLCLHYDINTAVYVKTVFQGIFD